MSKIETNKNTKNFGKPIKILGVVIVVLVVLIFAFTIATKPYDRSDHLYKQITISDGATTEDIANTLEDSGIIGSKGKFTFLSKLFMYSSKYKPGIYALSPSMSLDEIASTLVKGITTDQGFKLPAGYTIEQTASALEQAGFVDKNSFLAVANSGVYSEIFPFLEGYTSLEGFLLPGKYEMSKDADSAMIVATMLYNFNDFYTPELQAKAASLNLTTRQLVIISSIVERDTGIDKEREQIAAVILNRFRNGMTYQVNGVSTDNALCNPSKESIEAVLNCSGTDYLYYSKSSKLDGSHKFTSSYDEYAANESEYSQAKEANKKSED